jgi:hypothetical protein
MKKGLKLYSFSQLFAAVFFIMALVWLTLGTSFVYSAQQEWAKLQKMSKKASPLSNAENEASNLPGNDAEGKTPVNNTLSEEFIHEHHSAIHFPVKLSTYHNSESADIYIAFHRELLVPPPNQL